MTVFTPVVICFHFSIFEVSETSFICFFVKGIKLWFAFILVSLKYRKHRSLTVHEIRIVVICFHFSIFEVSETSVSSEPCATSELWFAFILVSLKYRKHHYYIINPHADKLWFAFILVSLKYRKHQFYQYQLLY